MILFNHFLKKITKIILQIILVPKRRRARARIENFNCQKTLQVKFSGQSSILLHEYKSHF
jgi:hypothetical protein